METILKIDNIRFKDILKYPNTEIESGKTIFLSGPSGTGKSTFLKLLNGTESISAGTIEFMGKDISLIDTIELRKGMLLVGQDVFLFHDTILENFKMFYSYVDKPVPGKEEIMEYLDLCLVEFPMEADCSTMSGGEKQRVFIAIYLSFKPKVLMLDEPTSAMDAELSNKLLGNIKEYCKKYGITLLVISHDKTLMEAYADEIIYFERGMRL